MKVNRASYERREEKRRTLVRFSSRNNNVRARSMLIFKLFVNRRCPTTTRLTPVISPLPNTALPWVPELFFVPVLRNLPPAGANPNVRELACKSIRGSRYLQPLLAKTANISIGLRVFQDTEEASFLSI